MYVVKILIMLWKPWMLFGWRTDKNDFYCPPSPAFTHLLRIGDVTGVGQDKSAKLVKILHCPPPLVRRSESLKQSPRHESHRANRHADMALTQTPLQYGHGANCNSRRREKRKRSKHKLTPWRQTSRNVNGIGVNTFSDWVTMADIASD